MCGKRQGAHERCIAEGQAEPATGAQHARQLGEREFQFVPEIQGVHRQRRIDAGLIQRQRMGVAEVELGPIL